MDRAKTWDTAEKEELSLWDHTANKGKGGWKPVYEIHPSRAIRYLGVMVAADRNSKPQTEKVLKLVAGVTEKIRQGQCSGELALGVDIEMIDMSHAQEQYPKKKQRAMLTRKMLVLGEELDRGSLPRVHDGERRRSFNM